MFAGKPIIGIVGGIGSGKSFVASLFAELGCLVIDSDAQVRAIYEQPDVRARLREWWGDAIFRPDGSLDRAAVARRVFADQAERRRLEELIHPRVGEMRDAVMRQAAGDPGVVAFVWDTPLLLEAGLRDQCDAVVFVDAPREVRLERVRATRGWDEAELARRENSQWPLDKKREMSDDAVVNTASAVPNAASAQAVRDQVRRVLSRILARTSKRTGLQS